MPVVGVPAHRRCPRLGEDNRPTMQIKNELQRARPRAVFRIAAMLVGVLFLTNLVDRTPEGVAGTPRRHAFDGLLAAWAQPAPEVAQTHEPGIRKKPRCPECGVIVSSSETETPEEAGAASADAPATVSSRRWLTIRFADGSKRVIDDPSGAQWRLDQRVMVVGGAAPGR